jgi:hypothetical protein
MQLNTALCETGGAGEQCSPQWNVLSLAARAW